MQEGPDKQGHAERARRYRELSEKAEISAEAMPTLELREGYWKLASDWRALAARVEELAGLPPQSRRKP